jgi:anti-sigma B factor antagonist
MGEIRIIAPRGEVDAGTVRDLGSALSEAAGDLSRTVMVDLSLVTFMDSSGLGALLRCHERLRRQGRPLVLIVPDGNAAVSVLEVSGVRRRLNVFTERADGERFLEG